MFYPQCEGRRIGVRERVRTQFSLKLLCHSKRVTPVESSWQKNATETKNPGRKVPKASLSHVF